MGEQKELVERLRHEADEHEKFYPSDTLHGMLREAADVISKLPLTADNVPVVPGMELWKFSQWSGYVFECLDDSSIRACRPDFFAEAYSTREAAQAAAEASK